MNGEVPPGNYPGIVYLYRHHGSWNNLSAGTSRTAVPNHGYFPGKTLAWVRLRFPEWGSCTFDRELDDGGRTPVSAVWKVSPRIPDKSALSGTLAGDDTGEWGRASLNLPYPGIGGR